MSNDGWIKISRKLLDWEWIDDPITSWLWFKLLLKANYEDKKWHGIVIKRGQVVISYASLANKHVSIKQIRTALKRLVESGCVGKQTASQYTIVTINNYDRYQQKEESKSDEEGKQGASEGQAEGKQGATTKEIKKERNKEEIQLTSNSNELSVNCSSAETPDPLDWDAFIRFFNEKMRDKAIPPISKLTDKRKQNVKARLREYGKQAIGQVIINAAESDFLNGKNDKAWTAKFDWLFLPTNFPKVLEGNYKNKDATDRTNYQAEQRRLAVEEQVARLLAEDGYS
ncbi:MAG: hypothetical protein KBT34_10640 [Prevotella sp.]|nr:hypothetical protein [Candidatus Prevotella equi]